MRFIHIADVHLGVKPDAGKSWSKKREQDIWASFARVIEIAGEKKVDFLLISGDLFHAQPLKKELREVNYLFSRIPETKIILMAGNHDYIRQKSYYLSVEWPKNVYFFQQEEAGHFDFNEENVSIYGLSYWHREIREKLYDRIVPTDLSRINVLLAHGGDSSHIPFGTEQILQNGFDYVAAGHIHKGGWLVPEHAVMAGSLEPTDCNDTGPHGYWMGEIEKERTAVHFYPIKNCEYCHEIYPVTGETAEREIYEWAEKLLGERPTYQYFRLFLKGRRNPDITYDMSRLEQTDRVVDVVEQMELDYNYEKLAAEYGDSLLGAYIRSLQNMPADEVTKKALEYGVNVLLGHKI
ncbi:MAG: DNA repair exonuclease [Clostridiales bacterium]|nr:DNA repair exonuclease [Clostridiales bacterium]